MSSSFDRAIKDLVQIMTEPKKNKTSPYDTQAEVIRVDGDTAWVHIPGGVDETPVRLTMNAQAGDIVQVRVSGGNAWLAGNVTSPPTDDKVANQAMGVAASAQKDILIVKDIVAESIQATNAKFEYVEADTAKIHSLEADEIHAGITYTNELIAGGVTTEKLTAASGYIQELVAEDITAQDIITDHAEINDLDVNYAQIDAANINTAAIRSAWVDQMMVQSGLIAHEGTVYELDAIQVNASKIKTGTLDVERLIVSVPDPQDPTKIHKYMVHVDPSTGSPSYEKVDADVLEDLTITADKIVAGAITAEKITTENIVGSGGWINLRNGTFNYTNASTGNGISWDGQHLNIKGSVNVTSGNVYTKTEADDKYVQASDSKSGSIVTWENMLIDDLDVDIEPIQSLNGYDKPWSGGAGKNLVPLTLENIKSQNISGVWSDNVFTTRGVTFTVNLDDAGNVESISATGTPTASIYFFLSDNIEWKAGQRITSGITSGGNSTYGFGLASTGDWCYTTPRTISSDVSTKCAIWYGTAAGTVNHKWYPMIVASTETDLTFAPYSNICPISGYDSVVVSRCGVNVWDEEWELGVFDNATGQKINNNSNSRSKNYISVKPSTQYYFKSVSNGRFFFYKADKTYISTQAKVANTVITTPSEAHYMMFQFGGTTYNHDISINYPSTDTSYHAYNGNTYTTDLSGTRYGGTLDVVSGVLTVDRAYTTVSSLGGRVGTNNNIYWSSAISSTVKRPSSNTQNANLVSDKFVSRPYDGTGGLLNGTAGGIAVNTGGTLEVAFGENGYTTLEEANTYLSSNPLQVVYPLATPTTVQLTAQEVSALVGTNVLWANSGDVHVELTGVKDYADEISELKVTADGISTEVAKKTDKATIISTIRQSAETVKIKASQVEIDGTATFNAIKSQTDATYDAKGAANAIQVGGTNLLRGTATQDASLGNSRDSVVETSDKFLGCTVFRSNTAWADIGFEFDKQLANTNKVKAGDTITYSIWAKTDDTVARDIFGVWVTKADGSGNYISGTKIATLTNTWTQYSKTFEVTAAMIDGSSTRARLTRFECNTSCTSGKYIYWAAPKVELGNKATTWTPAPEDVQAEIDAKKSVHTLDTAYSYTYANILTYSAEGYSDSWNLASPSTTTGVKVGDTVRLKVTVSDMSNAAVYIVGTVTNVASGRTDRLTMTSHGLDTTIIDGGNILTNSIGANQIAANAISIGKLDSSTQTKVNNGDSALSKVDYYNRTCLVGNSANTQTKYWRKFASYSETRQNSDPFIIFDVMSNGDFSSLKRCGRIKAHIRTTTVGAVEANRETLEWISRSEGIILSDFVLAYKATSGTDVKVELWCRCPASWGGYRFNMVQEGNRTGASSSAMWTLYDSFTSDGAESITSGYTQVTSTDIDAARTTATSYITNIDSNNGITIKAVNGATSGSDTTKQNYIKLNADGLDVYKGGTSVAKYGDTSRIGKVANDQSRIDISGTNIDFISRDSSGTDSILRMSRTGNSFEIGSTNSNVGLNLWDSTIDPGYSLGASVSSNDSCSCSISGTAYRARITGVYNASIWKGLEYRITTNELTSEATLTFEKRSGTPERAIFMEDSQSNPSPRKVLSYDASNNCILGQGQWAVNTSGYNTYVEGYETNIWGRNKIATNMAITQGSDKRLKKDIKDLEDVKDFVMDLKPVEFKYEFASDKDKHLGFIAQDVEKSMDAYGLSSNKYGLTTEITGTDNIQYKGLNYTEFIPICIKMIQEQQQEIDTLKEVLNEILGN